MVMGSASQCPCCGRTEMSCVIGGLCGSCETNYEYCEPIVNDEICTRCKGTGWSLKATSCVLCNFPATKSAIHRQGGRFAVCDNHAEAGIKEGSWDRDDLEDIPELIQKPVKGTKMDRDQVIPLGPYTLKPKFKLGEQVFTITKGTAEKKISCITCEETGKITFKDEQYRCPKCGGLKYIKHTLHNAWFLSDKRHHRKPPM